MADGFMTIDIPSGNVRLDGLLVKGFNRKPYVQIDGNNVYLDDEHARIAREMRKAFKPLIERKGRKHGRADQTFLEKCEPEEF